MRYLCRAIPVVVAAAIALLAGCGNKPAPPATTAALARPLLQLDAKTGRVFVPQSAVVERGGIPGVFVLTEAYQARFRMVRSGKTADDRIEILSGLSGSETLITGDLNGVHDGSLIRPP
jgi:multidrug efflux pump subunit AcrA (membrane-fusion protein)